MRADVRRAAGREDASNPPADVGRRWGRKTSEGGSAALGLAGRTDQGPSAEGGRTPCRRRVEAVEARMRFEPCDSQRGRRQTRPPVGSRLSRRLGVGLDRFDVSRRGKAVVPVLRTFEERSSIRNVDAGAGPHPPDFYGGKPGKSQTAPAIMDADAKFWERRTAFASCENALNSLQRSRLGWPQRRRMCLPVPRRRRVFASPSPAFG